MLQSTNMTYNNLGDRQQLDLTLQNLSCESNLFNDSFELLNESFAN